MDKDSTDPPQVIADFVAFCLYFSMLKNSESEIKEMFFTEQSKHSLQRHNLMRRITNTQTKKDTSLLFCIKTKDAPLTIRWLVILNDLLCILFKINLEYFM